MTTPLPPALLCSLSLPSGAITSMADLKTKQTNIKPQVKLQVKPNYEAVSRMSVFLTEKSL